MSKFFLDSNIIATALQANCTTLYTEDMHHNLVIEGTLTILNRKCAEVCLYFVPTELN